MDFTHSDIDRSFAPTIWERGHAYFKKGKVIDAGIDGRGRIWGKVHGSEWEPYRVCLTCYRKGDGIEISSECTCPYETQCKHGAAVALFAVERGVRKLREEDMELFVFDDDLYDEDDEYEDEYEEADPEPAPPREFVLPSPAPAVNLDVPMPTDLRDWLKGVEAAMADDRAPDPEAKLRLFYRLRLNAMAGETYLLSVQPTHRSLLKSGAFGAMSDVKNGTITNWQKPKHWTPYDLDLIADLLANGKSQGYKTEYTLDGRHGERLLRDVLNSGRAVWTDGEPVHLGSTRHARFEWEGKGKKGAITPKLRLEGNGVVLAMARPWYVDISKLEIGPVECDADPELIAALVRRGTVEPEHIQAVKGALERMGVPNGLLPSGGKNVVVLAPAPVPCLSIDFELCGVKTYWGSPSVVAPLAFAKLTFEYDGIRAPVDGQDIRYVVDGEVRLLRRNDRAEENARQSLLNWGWRETAYSGWDIPKGRVKSLCLVPSNEALLGEPVEKVQVFAATVVPKLLGAGWKVDLDTNFRFVPETEVEWDVALEEGSGLDWFQFRLGIRVEGEPFDLRPILAQALREQLGRPKSDEMFVFGLEGRAIRLSRKRVSALLQPLLELFGGMAEWPSELQLPKSALPELDRLHERAAEEKIVWRTTEELKRLEQKFKSFDCLEPAQEPENFAGELRGYQREGLAWLQFLREYGFGGVLADDMGLGKTVQVLAHIQTEKVAGRMDRPCLIVAPTSTIPNWRRECERFAPELKVVSLRGGKRSERFADLASADVALTTYPLLARDREHLSKVSYHLLVLDEAQNIKNPATAAAKAARELEARHRIALSGTPVENHLGELWSLFQFLMPGFLGTDADFRKRYRTPIEKQADGGARARLARRIRPFMLRRTKGQVVLELPPKTEVVETIEFDDPQRDLYESIRVAMDEHVRNLIASQGFEKSRIQVLDALLKLRQVCCDPRLVKLSAAKKVVGSGKLDRLIEMLGVLLQDGRRILLFSQFTSMLDLIEERLRAEGFSWVRISGDTEDRETPVTRFQTGEVPLFLISLRAGGTGLNLTAADTVILYDPWWNPAVENQAIDRAHRIGQENPVIVYKMVAAGTIEEKMLEMQAKKGDLARSILSDDAEGIRALSADDLRWMLAKDEVP